MKTLTLSSAFGIFALVFAGNAAALTPSFTTPELGEIGISHSDFVVPGEPGLAALFDLDRDRFDPAPRDVASIGLDSNHTAEVLPR